jgi:miniconductance mechanosensitive channel
MPLMNDPAIWFKDLFVHAGFSYSLSSFLSTIALVLIVILLSWFSNIIAKAVILKVVTRIVKKTAVTWDDIFLEQKVFHAVIPFRSCTCNMVHVSLGS